MKEYKWTKQDVDNLKNNLHILNDNLRWVFLACIVNIIFTCYTM